MSQPALRLRPVAEDGAPERGERHASWLELFFDLVFVLAVAEVAGVLERDLSPAGFARFAALFVPVWWSWVGYTFYADRFENDRDTVYRVLTFAGMLAVAALSVNVRHAFSSARADDFIFCYVAVRMVLIVLNARAWRGVPAARELTGTFVVAFAVGAGLWLLSAFVPAGPTRYGLWAMALVIELTAPLLRRQVGRRTPIDVSHIPERFGLFTIIVLGEAVLAVATAVADTQWGWRTALTAAGGFAVAACLWWAYFDFLAPGITREHLRRGAAGYLYFHLPVVLGLTIAAVGAEHAIHESAHHAHLGLATRTALCGGVALFLASLTAVNRCLGRRCPLRATVFQPGALLGLIALGGALPPIALVGLLLAVLVVGIGAGARIQTS